MKKARAWTLTAVLIFLWTPNTYAGSSADIAPGSPTPAPTPTTVMTPTPTGTTTTTTTTTNLQNGQFPGQIYTNTMSNTSPSINPSANIGQASQNNGAGVNNAAGAALIAAGVPLLAQPPTAPMGAMLIAMGMMALAQGGADSNAAGQSGNTAAASVNGVGGAATNPATQPGFGSGTAGFNSPAANTGQQALTNAGYTLNGDGLTAPDGTTTPLSSVGTSGGMAHAGLSASNIADVNKLLADVNAKAAADMKGAVSSVGVAEGGGSGPANAAGPDSNFKFNNPFKLADATKKQMIAGKTVLFDGDPIGVRGADIFEMIHSAYQTKRARNDFLENENGVMPATPTPTLAAKPTLSRAPASVFKKTTGSRP